MNQALYNPVDQIENFLLSIYGHCLTQGMTNQSAERKVFRSAYEAIFSLQERSENNSREHTVLEHSLAIQEFLSQYANSLLVEGNPIEGKEKVLDKVAHVFEANKELIDFLQSES